jgi:aminoglycoside phosphotransferase family enzyme
VFDGDLVHKRKKPVQFAFVDLSTRERREAVCRREVELNCRFSCDVFLGVEEVLDEAGQVGDHAVVMRRMPADRRLASLMQQHRDVAVCLRSIARTMADADDRGAHTGASSMLAQSPLPTGGEARLGR